MSCNRFQYFNDTFQRCLHQSLGQPNMFSGVAAISILFGVAFSSATGFGSAAFQIFVLMLLLNYGKRDASSMSQPMQAGMFLSTIIQNSKKKQEDDTPLVNYNVALLIIPNMITGAIAGLHLKDYIPSLVSVFFFVFQMLVLLYSTHKKSKQVNQLKQVHKEVPDETVHEDMLNMGDGVNMDYEEFFKQVRRSTVRPQFIKHMPAELLELDITVDEHKMRVKDYLNQNSDIPSKLSSVISKPRVPYFKIVLIGLTIVVNLVLLLNTGISTDQCHSQYWAKFPRQIVMNLVLFVGIAIITRTKSIKLLLKFALMGWVFGFCLGVVGMGASLFLILALSKTRELAMTQKQISATLPIIMLSVTCTGCILQIINGILYDIFGSVVMFILAFLSQYFVNPKINKLVNPNKSLKFAQVFQLILLIGYLGMTLPKMLKEPIMNQLRPKQLC